MTARDAPPQKRRVADALRALALNLVPAVGTAAFGWSYLVALLAIYVDAFAVVAAVSLVLAVSIAHEDPPPWAVRSAAAHMRYVAAVWAAAAALLGFFPFVGAVLLFSMLGMPWRQLSAEVAAEPAFGAGVIFVASVRLRDAFAGLRGDLASAEREAMDDFTMMLLRAFAFPVAGGLVLAGAAAFGRSGQVVVLVLLALTITGGDVWRDRWVSLFRSHAPHSPP